MAAPHSQCSRLKKPKGKAMPRLIKASLDPGKLRSTAEASRGGYKRPAEKDAAKVASEVIGLTGAVMKHPVTDLIVRGVNELVLLGKKDTPGYEGLLEQRRERLKQKAARRKAGPAPIAVKPRITSFTDVASGTPIGESFDRAAEVEMARARKQPAPAAPPAAMPPQPPPAATAPAAPVKKVEEPKIEIPRTVEEIMAFVANPIASPEDLNWAMTQVAKFAPVLGLDDIGRPKTAYSSVILESYAKGKKRVPTELDLQKQAVKEREVRLKETGALDKQTTRKEEIIKVSFLEKAKDARAQIAAAAAREKASGKGKSKTDAGKAGLDGLRTIATALKVGFANNSLSADQLSELGGLYREATTALKPGTEGSGYIGKLKIRALKKYFGEIFGPSYVNPIDESDLGRHSDLGEVDRYIKRRLAQARNILSKEAKEHDRLFREARTKEALEGRAKAVVTAAETLFAERRGELKAAISDAGREGKRVIKLVRGKYKRKGTDKIDDKALSEAWANYTAAEKALSTARSKETGGVN